MSRPIDLIVVIRAHAPDAIVTDGTTHVVYVDRLHTPQRLRRLQRRATDAGRTVQDQVRWALGLDDDPPAEPQP
jgi:hypothetical protein